MSDSLELQRHEPLPVTKPQPQVADMLQAVLERGMTSETVGVVREMAQLLREEKAAEAEKKFNRAFVKLQRELKTVVADKVVRDRNDKPMYSYCSYEEIHDQTRDAMIENGFSVRFSQDMNEKGRVVVTCWLIHEEGHSVQSHYAVRPATSGPPGSNETKLDAGASTVAQREAFCDALNIVRRGLDNDAHNEGAPITAEQAKDLERRALATGSDIARFLRFAKAESFDKITSERYAELDDNLRRKEKTQ